MGFLEKDLEDIIFEADREELLKRGLPIRGKVYRQLQIGNYGRADLVSVERGFDFIDGVFERVLFINVFELKKDALTIDALIQAKRYASGIRRFLDKRDFSHSAIINTTIIGNSINSGGDWIYMLNDYKIKTYTYDYRFDGIFFTRHNDWSLVNDGFYIK